MNNVELMIADINFSLLKFKREAKRSGGMMLPIVAERLTMNIERAINHYLEVFENEKIPEALGLGPRQVNLEEEILQRTNRLGEDSGS